MFRKKTYSIWVFLFLTLFLTAVSINAIGLAIDKDLQVDQKYLDILEPVFVERVIDGDTFQIMNNRRVRLLGIDTPEIKNKGKINLNYGDEARRYSRQLLEGKVVYLEYDIRQKDRFGRILAYVFLEDGTFLNARLLASGYAHLFTIPPDVKYVELFEKLARKAKMKNRGLWGKYIEQTSDLPEIKWEEAEDHIGETVVVTGTVVDTYNSGKAVFLNFDMEYWHTFSAVIFTGDKCKFAVEPAEYYLNKKVKVIGKIELYKDAPEVIVSHPVQIRTID